MKNNCETCRHSQHQDGGHCYMFEREPEFQCMQHTRRVDAWRKLKESQELNAVLRRMSEK